jgi:hypothetical protein
MIHVITKVVWNTLLYMAQSFCYNFTSTRQLSNIRQFLSDNFSKVTLCYQADKLRITKWSKPRGGGLAPPSKCWKIRPQILHSEGLCQCSNLLKKTSFFTRSNKKVVNFKEINLYTDSLVQTRNSQHKMKWGNTEHWSKKNLYNTLVG